MVEHKFNNKYDLILCTGSLLLDCSKREDRLIAGPCIWWLASIILFTEIITFYHYYKIFPSDYVINLKVTPLPSQVSEEMVVPESDIPVWDNNNSSDTEIHLSRENLLPKYQIDYQTNFNKTQSGQIFKSEPKYQEPTI